MRLEALALFAFIPLVLFLFLRQPLGPAWSVLLGVAIMIGHRFVAAPWAAKYADVRCLWCGRLGGTTQVDIVAGGRTWHMHACSEAHADRVARFLLFVDRFRAPIAAGIFLPLAWLLAASLASAAGHPLLPHVINALFFRVVVASTVVLVSFTYLAVPSGSSAGLLGRRSGPREGSSAGGPSLRYPFPIHNLSLLGIGNTLWVFRVVGLWWIVDAVARLV